MYAVDHTQSTVDTEVFRTPAKALSRPGLRSGRWRGRLGLLRAKQRRLVFSLAVGLGTGFGTLVALLSVAGGPGDTNGDGVERIDPISAAAQIEPSSSAVAPDALPPETRIVALDRSVVGIPVHEGDRLELVGLRPTVETMAAEIVASEAVVVGLNADVVLVMVSDDQALRVAEVSAVGALVVFGLSPVAPVDGAG